MKKHENSSVCIKHIMITALLLVVATFGGLNAYRIVCDKEANTILEIESANADINDFKAALVENTEEDLIYAKNIKFLAAKIVDNPSGDEMKIELKTESKADLKLANDAGEGGSYKEKVTSRGTYLREQVASEIVTNATKNLDDTKENQNEEENDNKLLNTVIKEIKELGIIQNELLITEKSNSGDSAKVDEKVNDDSKNEDEEITNLDLETVTEIIEPVAEVVETKENILNTEENFTPPTEYLRTIDVKATAYCLCKKCCGKSPSNPAYGITASGLKITPGEGMKVVASDPKVIPLGTNVYIEGLYGAKDYGYAIVADTGSAIKNLKIDLYMDTHQMALNWGVKSVRVYILDK